MRLSFFVFTDLYRMDFIAAEIGVCKGDNAQKMLDYTPKLKKLYLIDHYPPNDKAFTFCGPKGVQTYLEEQTDQFYKMVQRRFRSYGERVEFIRMPSIEAVKRFPDNFFDYVYIDGAHDYDNVKQDIEAWYPKVKEFGILGGHDSTALGVDIAIAEFANKYSLNLFSSGVLICSNFLNNEEVEFLDWWLIK